MHPGTHFTAVAAVEGWDAWFRCRDADGQLLDRTIDATWWRVARAIAAIDEPQPEAWARRFVEAFGSWRLLPDERLLRVAGTRTPLAGEYLEATLNAGAFVLPRGGLDLERLADTAALAVRLLDDALLALAPAGMPRDRVGIGLLGVADALRRLGVPYADPQAATVAAKIAAALADGALRGAVELARERGGSLPEAERLQAWTARGTDPQLVAEAAATGVRFARLTAIAPQPRLACLANLASDALDPDRGPGDADLEAQLRLRVAVQPWIDAPICQPLRAAAMPSEEQLRRLAQVAQDHGLTAPPVQCATAPAAKP
jgi:ribonucleoside-diphosphate reductase alpha chain